MTASDFLSSTLHGILLSIATVWSEVWWFALPLITFFIFWDFWVIYIRYRFIAAINWVLLEVKVPKNLLQSPKSMEQIFAAAHAPYSYGLRFLEEYWEGRVEYWMSFEIVGSAGETHFYIRMPKQYRNLMESAIYGQYPDAEVTEVEDYEKELSGPFPNNMYDLYGAELVLKEPDPYPIRTYLAFEDPIEERRVDTIAAMTETISKLKADEHIWIQILARPIGDHWKKEGERIIDKITGKEEMKKKKSGRPLFGVAFQDAVLAPFRHPPIGEKKKEERSLNLRFLNPIEQDMTKAISLKTGKLGFQTTIRYLYIDRRDAFSRDNVAAVTGYFRQFNTQNLNLLRPDKRTMTASVHGLLKKRRLEYRKRVIWEHFRDLKFNAKKSILNIEELATIYHFPIVQVTAAELERVPSRKGSPPPSLPVAE